ncbi:MAG: [FeFe] hydrogenase H-cluster maturation GTPase HydF [Eubacteriales bacterium]|nr:[FeFe] hydrogenase H-cluster maturation GTPase HydF [Eubacteriales bacterium]
MSLNQTPRSDRLHIGIYGKRNSGKSSLVNALTGQQVALTSPVAGTTADPVYKAMEIHGIGPVVFIDTAGFDDEGELGRLRVEKTRAALQKTDIALLVCADGELTGEKAWVDSFRAAHIPFLTIVNKTDALHDAPALCRQVEKTLGATPIAVSARTGDNVRAVIDALIRALPEDYGAASITGHLVHEGDLVLLVMPQGIQAPKGRLILPQVQTIRDLLDAKCLVMSCTTDKLEETLAALARPPKLIITDSQVFARVYEKKPPESLLTSFSVLFARHKGDIEAFVQGAAAIDALTPASRVLIAEACTHAPLTEDIGREKIPRMLRKRVSPELKIDVVSGNDFPADLTPYSLIIHCGACMFNRRYVLSRIAAAQAAGVPITNYGVTIAKVTGILDRIVW